MRKLKSNAGLTLVELMCTILILSLISAAMATGVKFATDNYLSSTMNARARILCSFLTTAISDELRYAEDIKVVTETTNEECTYSDPDPTSDAAIVNPAFTSQVSTYVVNGRFTVKEDGDEKGRLLLNNNDLAIAVGLYSTGESRVRVAEMTNNTSEIDKFWIEYDPATQTFTVNLVVTACGNETPLVTSQFQVRSMNAAANS